MDHFWVQFNSAKNVSETFIKRKEAIKGKNIGPEKSECFTMRFSVENTTKIPTSCTSGYFHQNGFAMTKEECLEAYPNRHKKEYSQIKVNSPTDVLELTIRFPCGFEPDNFGVEVFKEKILCHDLKDTVEQMLPLDSMSNEWLEVDSEERLSLINNISFTSKRYAASDEWDDSDLFCEKPTNELNLRINKPRLDRVYVIWWLPPKDMREKQSVNHLLKDKMRTILAKGQDSKFETFYNKLAKNIKNKVDSVSEDNQLQVYLLGWESKKGCLCVSGSPSGVQKDSLPLLIYGRGPAGQAFKKRTSTSWPDAYFRHLEDRDEQYRKFLCIEPILPYESEVTGVISIPLLYPLNDSDLDELKNAMTAEYMENLSYYVSQENTKQKQGLDENSEYYLKLLENNSALKVQLHYTAAQDTFRMVPLGVVSIVTTNPESCIIEPDIENADLQSIWYNLVDDLCLITINAVKSLMDN